MSIQIICKNEEAVDFPREFFLYSEVIQKPEEQPMDNEYEAGSGSEDEDDGEKVEEVEQIVVPATQESVNLMLALLKMEYTKNPSNILPPKTPKKVTAPKFKIEETIGPDVVEFFKEAGKDAVFAITQTADFLGIKLIAHLCFTWIAHNLNTRSTEEKMKWLGIDKKEKPPTFEEIMEVDLKTGKIPSMDNTGGATKKGKATEEGGATKKGKATEEGGATKSSSAHIESKEGN